MMALVNWINFSPSPSISLSLSLSLSLSIPSIFLPALYTPSFLRLLHYSRISPLQLCHMVKS